MSLGGSTVRCNSAFVVGGELNEDTAQVCLPEHGQVVDALHLAGESPHRWCASDALRRAGVTAEKSGANQTKPR